MPAPLPSYGSIEPAPNDIASSSVETLRHNEQDEESSKLLDNPPGLMKSRFDGLDPWQTVWIFRRCVWFVFVLTTMNMLDGWQIGIAGAIIVNRGFVKQFGEPQPHGPPKISDTWLSAWGAVINVGQMTAMLYIPYVADRYGRKMAYLICWFNFIACLVCLTLARTPAVWCLGKWFVGMAAGSVQMTTGPYLVEIAPTNIRGALSVFPGLWSGACGVVNAILLQVSNKRYPDNYLLPIYVLWGLSGVMLAAILHLPESPWTHARHGQKEKGFNVLERLYGNVPGYDYEEEWGIIVRTLEHERASKDEDEDRWSDLFEGDNLRRTGLLMGTYFGQLWAGLSLIGTYGTYFFSVAGLNDPFLASLIISCVGLANTLFYGFLMDSVGRRLLLCSAYSITSTTLWLIGGLSYLPGKARTSILIVLCCIWNCSFGIVGGVSVLQSSEIPSARLRVKTVTFSLLTGACFGIVTCFCVPPLLDLMGIKASLVFAATSLPCAVGFWFLIPETKGRSAAEIDELYEARIPAWKWRGYMTEVERHSCTVERTRAP